MDEIDGLKRQIQDKEAELERLRSRLHAAEGLTAAEGLGQEQKPEPPPSTRDDQPKNTEWKWPLLTDEYERYGRQLLIPEVGVKGATTLPSPALPDSSPTPLCDSH